MTTERPSSERERIAGGDMVPPSPGDAYDPGPSRPFASAWPSSQDRPGEVSSPSEGADPAWAYEAAQEFAGNGLGSYHPTTDGGPPVPHAADDDPAEPHPVQRAPTSGAEPPGDAGEAPSVDIVPERATLRTLHDARRAEADGTAQGPPARIRPGAPTKVPTWWREALLRWEDLWYGRRTRPLVLVALCALLVLGGLGLRGSQRPTVPAASSTLATAAPPEQSVAPRVEAAAPPPASASAAPSPALAAPPPGWIIFQSSRESPGALQLFASMSDGSGLRRIPSTPRNAANPRLSPDGTRIAFVGSDGGTDDLYTVGLDGADLRRITTGPGNNRFPPWSPDGKRLAFGSDRDGNWEIYAVDAAGGAVTRLTNDPADDNLPSWSPDGQWLAFQSDRARGMHIYTMRATGGGASKITDSNGADRYPVWSPDGRRLAYYSDRDGGRDQLFAIDAEGGHDRRLVVSPGKDQLPTWSPDGRWLAFASERAGTWAIYLLQIETGEQRLLIQQPDVWAPNWGASH